MSWLLSTDRPIYLQLVEQIEEKILSGEYTAGAKLPSVRELATLASVNPNTMQKALVELERTGLIITNRTSGRVITENKEMLNRMRETIAKEHLEEFLNKMKQLGFTTEELIKLLNEEAQTSKSEN